MLAGLVERADQDYPRCVQRLLRVVLDILFDPPECFCAGHGRVSYWMRLVADWREWGLTLNRVQVVRVWRQIDDDRAAAVDKPLQPAELIVVQRGVVADDDAAESTVQRRVKLDSVDGWSDEKRQSGGSKTGG